MFSIIVPVYNVEKYVSRCIESIRSQTYDNWELILIDDGSTDNSGKICDKYSADIRINIIHQNNQGVSRARNKGIECAKGENILFIDSDDWLDKRALEEYQKGFDKKADIVACDMALVYNEQGDYKIANKWDGQGDRLVQGRDILFSILKKSAILGNKAFKKKVIEDIWFNPQMSFGEDTEFLAKVLLKTKSIWLSNHCSYFYYEVRPGNVVSSPLSKKDLEFIENNYKIYDILKNSNDRTIAVHRINVAIGQIIEKIRVTDDDKDNIYVKKCKRLARYPSLINVFLYLIDYRYKPSRRIRYLVWLISPQLWIYIKKRKIHYLDQ